MPNIPFDAQQVTDRLQDAVRRHDQPLLNQLLSGRFVLVSGRSLGRLGKEDWIAAALQVEWRSFVVSVSAVTDLDGVTIVEHDIEQEMATAPSWDPEAPSRTRWVTTDIWAVEDGEWRLVSRHPELTG